MFPAVKCFTKIMQQGTNFRTFNCSHLNPFKHVGDILQTSLKFIQLLSIDSSETYLNRYSHITPTASYKIHATRRSYRFPGAGCVIMLLGNSLSFCTCLYYLLTIDNFRAWKIIQNWFGEHSGNIRRMLWLPHLFDMSPIDCLYDLVEGFIGMQDPALKNIMEPWIATETAWLKISQYFPSTCGIDEAQSCFTWSG